VYVGVSGPECRPNSGLENSKPFENVSQFRYLGSTVRNQNLIQGEIKRRLNSGNACYHSVQNLLSSRLLLNNVKVRIYIYIYNFACGYVWMFTVSVSS
jgi:hypothetical protein